MIRNHKQITPGLLFGSAAKSHNLYQSFAYRIQDFLGRPWADLILLYDFTCPWISQQGLENEPVNP